MLRDIKKSQYDGEMGRWGDAGKKDGEMR